jgi:hypothetical protein
MANALGGLGHKTSIVTASFFSSSVPAIEVAP